MKSGTDTAAKRTLRVFGAEDNRCIWMKAGVISLKTCENAYDCLSCPFDKAMSRKMGKKGDAAVGWREAMKETPYEDRKCRHMLTGRVRYHYCSNSYRCNICEFDQTLDELDLSIHPGAAPVKNISGFLAAEGYYYHSGHTWARIEHGGLVRIGMDDFALKLMGSPTAARLPKLGARLDQGEPGWSVEWGSRSVGMKAPAAGVVLATNQRLLNRLESAKEDPYGSGWLIVVEPQGLRQNLKKLALDRGADAWLKDEIQKLEAMLAEAHTTLQAAMDANSSEGLLSALPESKRDEATRSFFSG